MKKILFSIVLILILGISVTAMADPSALDVSFSYYDTASEIPTQIYNLKAGTIKVHADVLTSAAIGQNVKLKVTVLKNGEVLSLAESEAKTVTDTGCFYLATDVKIEDASCVMVSEVVDAYGTVLAASEPFKFENTVVVPDPGKLTEPESKTVTLYVNGKPVTVRREQMKGMSEGGSRDKAPAYFNVAKLCLDTTERVTLELKGINGTVISEKWTVSPAELNIPRLVSKGTGYIFIDKPQTLFVRNWSNRSGEGYEDLIILITPTETDVPYKYHPSVTYYGYNGAVCPTTPEFSDNQIAYFEKGEHKNIGAMHLKPGMKLYLAPGAVLDAKIQTIGVTDNPNGIKVYGRGVLETRKSTNTGIKKGIYFENCKNVVIEGIGSRNAREWQTLYVNCSDFVIKNTNTMAILLNNDGIDLDGVDNFTIEDNFIMSADDCFGWHGVDYEKIATADHPYGRPTYNVTAKNNIMYNLIGNAIRFGSSAEQEKMYDIQIYDTYVLSKAGYGLAITIHDWAEVSDVLVENLYVEEGTSDFNGVLLVEVVQTSASRTEEGKALPSGLTSPAGNVKNVTIRNVKAPWNGSKQPITLGGYDKTHTVTGITFENVIIQKNADRYTGGQGTSPITKEDILLNASSLDGAMYVSDGDYTIK
ncbi:MAG: hypothetical protein IKJ55_01945 [Clostridia bacterium]|nr:hypothetical protein [Clostridia bacterium]